MNKNSEKKFDPTVVSTELEESKIKHYLRSGQVKYIKGYRFVWDPITDLKEGETFVFRNINKIVEKSNVNDNLHVYNNLNYDKNNDLGDDKNNDLGDDNLNYDKNHDLGDDKNHDLGEDNNLDGDNESNTTETGKSANKKVKTNIKINVAIDPLDNL